MNMTENVTHEATGITASRALWSALGFNVDINGVMSYGPHGINEILFAGIHATGARDERAALWAVAEVQRQREERTRVTAEARLGDAILALAKQLGEESAASLVQRMPARLRPYAEAVLGR